MNRIRVLVIDDSAYSRRTIIKLLEEIPQVDVVGYAMNGEEGLRKALDLRPDLITLDLEMPGMDGFTLLRIIMTACPTPVIVVSSHNEDERVFKALELGAVDFVAKPAKALSAELLSIGDELHRKVGSVLNLNLKGLKSRTVAAAVVAAPPVVKKPVKLPRGGIQKYQVVVIGSSTGGPPALQKILSQLPVTLPFPVLIAQHMPAGFTKTFAERLNRLLPFDVKEAADGEPVRANTVYIAPGGVNMIVATEQNDIIIRLKSPAVDEKYIPSVNALMMSAAELYKSRVLSLVLTGMGNDGSKGVVRIKVAGGAVLAEAEESSVVFGMPREAIATGAVDEVVHLDGMAEKIMEYCGYR